MRRRRTKSPRNPSSTVIVVILIKTFYKVTADLKTTARWTQILSIMYIPSYCRVIPPTVICINYNLTVISRNKNIHVPDCDCQDKSSKPFFYFKKLYRTAIIAYTVLRVDMVQTIHDDLLTQWTHIPMGQFFWYKLFPTTFGP